MSVVQVSVLVATTLFAPAGAAFSPSDGPIFNRPIGSHGAKFRLVRHVEKTIRSTRRGSTILIATYLMDRQETADKLIAAHRRGVAVKVIMDDGIESRPSRRLAAVLGKDRTARSFAVFCHNSCRGTRGQMHAKFYAFSKAGRSHNVVMVSSANLNNGGGKPGVERPLHDDRQEGTVRQVPRHSRRDGARPAGAAPRRALPGP